MRQRSRMLLVGVGLALIGVLAPALAAEAATPPQPRYKSAVVDGNPGEWRNKDVWGTLLSNGAGKPAVGSVSLRYDCNTKVLYVNVQAGAGIVFQTIDPAEAYVRLGQTGKLVSGLSGNDGTAPDFAWTGQNGDTATGFEASAVVEPGSYPASFRVHGKIPDDSADGYETFDLDPRYSDLEIVCKEKESCQDQLKRFFEWLANRHRGGHHRR